MPKHALPKKSSGTIQWHLMAQRTTVLEEKTIRYFEPEWVRETIMAWNRAPRNIVQEVKRNDAAVSKSWQHQMSLFQLPWQASNDSKLKCVCQEWSPSVLLERQLSDYKRFDLTTYDVLKRSKYQTNAVGNNWSLSLLLVCLLAPILLASLLNCLCGPLKLVYCDWCLLWPRWGLLHRVHLAIIQRMMTTTKFVVLVMCRAQAY